MSYCEVLKVKPFQKFGFDNYYDYMWYVDDQNRIIRVMENYRNPINIEEYIENGKFGKHNIIKSRY